MFLSAYRCNSMIQFIAALLLQYPANIHLESYMTDINSHRNMMIGHCLHQGKLSFCGMFSYPVTLAAGGGSALQVPPFSLYGQSVLVAMPLFWTVKSNAVSITPLLHSLLFITITQTLARRGRPSLQLANAENAQQHYFH